MLNPKISIFFFLTFFISCKKDKSGSQQNSSANPVVIRAHYVDTLKAKSQLSQNSHITTAGLTENFYMAHPISNSSCNVLRFDMEANLYFEMNISIETGMLMDFCGSKISDEFYTLSGTSNYPVPQPPAIQAYTFQLMHPDSVNNCNNAGNSQNYVFTNDFMVNQTDPATNYLQLKKFDARGNTLWSKTVEGCFNDANSMETDRLGNVYVLSITLKPRAAILSNLSGPVPYYYFENRNSFSILKFDS